IMVLAGSDHSLYVSTDFCQTWSDAHAKLVLAVDWGPAEEKYENTVFWTQKRKT
ncbi:hypothetical protein SARC_13948, partial [Sphaeroforma arctica JP610]